MKILIAVPTFESIFPDTFQSIYELDGGGHELSFAFVRGYDCATARNNIAQMSLDKGVDYVLMVDNDVILPKDALLWLLEDPRDVCLGYYVHRDWGRSGGNRTSVCRLGELNYSDQFSAQELGERRDAGETKIQIHGGGMGCALIRTDVFRRIKYPWYDWVNYHDDNRGMLSEDLYFCEQCKNAEIQVWTDARAACGHIIRYPQWPDYRSGLYEGGQMYRVLKLFEDLTDVEEGKPHRYQAGDLYPREGSTPTLARIAELSGRQNRRGEPLIEAIPEKEEEAPKPKKATRAKKPAAKKVTKDETT